MQRFKSKEDYIRNNFKNYILKLDILYQKKFVILINKTYEIIMNPNLNQNPNPDT